MKKKKFISIFLILVIVLINGCTVQVGSQKNYGKESVSGDVTKETSEEVNKNDIDKIEVAFSEDEGKFKRNIIIEPSKDKIKCSYSSTYLDNQLSSELDQKNYDAICNSIKKYKDMNWVTSDITQYQTDVYKVENLGICKVKIDSNIYSLDAQSTNKNLCQAIVSQTLNTVFPLKWEASTKVDMDKYCKIDFEYMNVNEKGINSEYISSNYVTNQNYFANGYDFIDKYFSEVDKTKKCIEYARTDEKRIDFAYIFMTGQEPLEYEYYNLISKIDFEKILSNDEKDKVKRDSNKEIREPVYMLEVVDKQENKRKSVVSEQTMNKLDQAKLTRNLLDWTMEIRSQFCER